MPAVKKADYNTKISETKKEILDHNYDKCITTQEFNKLTANNFAAKLKRANIAKYIDDFVERIDFDDKVARVSEKGYDFLLGRM